MRKISPGGIVQRLYVSRRALIGPIQNSLLSLVSSTHGPGIAKRKNEIGDAEFKRALTMGKEYLANHPGVARDGLPIYASLPAE
jgi:hypothetical protein